MTQSMQFGLKLPKMAEWTEMSARKWRSTLPFSAKWAIRPNELFGQILFSPNGFWQNGLSAKRGRIGQDKFDTNETFTNNFGMRLFSID
jgi:hypothetical protein